MAEFTTLLNAFYFNEFVPQLPPSLSILATDPQVLFHRELEGDFTLVTQQVRLEYWLIPWLLSDIFPADDEQIQIINQGFLLILLSYLVLDHLVDRQTPDSPLIPLLTHEFYFAASKQFSQVFQHNNPFWQTFYDNLKSHTTALATEYQSVTQVNPPFSYEIMQQVAVGKAMPFRIAVEAMGRLTGQEELISTIGQIFTLHMFADQFYDDAIDYLDDWKIKRYTMAMVYLAEAEQIPIQNLFNADANTIRDLTIQHNIRQKMVHQSTSLIQEALALLPPHLHETRLYTLLTERLNLDTKLLKSFRAVSFMRRLKQSLK